MKNLGKNKTKLVNNLLWIEGVTDEKGKPAGPGPEGYRFEHRLMVDAPAEDIWAELMDVNSWSEWSVLYPKAEGEITPDGEFSVDIQVPGTKPVPATAFVKGYEENRLFMFDSVTRIPESMMNGMRYFTIEEAGENQCIVCDGEVVGGILGVGSAKLMPGNLFKGLQLMNEGLKERAEARYQNRMNSMI